jgi:hypothetical protein
MDPLIQLMIQRERYNIGTIVICLVQSVEILLPFSCQVHSWMKDAQQNLPCALYKFDEVP